MRIVADTNVFLAVALEEPEKARIVETTAGHELLAPEVLPFEIGNALSALVRRGILDAHEAGLVWEVTQLIPVELQEVDIGQAIGLAAKSQLYAYDAYFLECALQSRAPLLTLDKRMRHVAVGLAIELLELPE